MMTKKEQVEFYQAMIKQDMEDIKGAREWIASGPKGVTSQALNALFSGIVHLEHRIITWEDTLDRLLKEEESHV